MPLKITNVPWLLSLVSFLMILFFACESDDGIEIDKTPPTVPGGLKALDVGDSHIDVAWEASGDNVAVTGYVVYLNDIQVANDSLTSYSATKLVPETEYTFKVRAIDAAENISSFTPAVQATTLKKVPKIDTDATVPTVPQNLTVSDITQTTADLNWEASTDSLGVVAYKVFQDTTLLATVLNTKFQATELSPGAEYSFFVSAIDKANNESVASKALTFTTETETYTVSRDTIPPTRPMDLIVLDSTQTTVGLSWATATDSIGVVGYKVFKDSIVIDTIQETQYEAIELNPGTIHSFAVSAFDAAANESTLSEALSVTTLDKASVEQDTIAPTRPENFAATDVNPDNITLNWDAAIDSIGVVGYRVFQDGIVQDTVTETQFQAVELTPATTYNFTISALDAAENESDLSELVSATTLEEVPVAQDTIAPTVPANLTTSEINLTSITLNWDAATDSIGVVGYRVFQDGTLQEVVTETQFQAAELTSGTAYNFTVLAFDAAENESALSTSLSVTTEEEIVEDTAAPTVPSNLVALNPTQTSIDLDWDAAADDNGISTYRIFQDGTPIRTVQETQYQVAGLSPGTDYNFAVSAIDTAENESSASAAVTVATEQAPDTVPPTSPSNMVASNTSQTATELRWNAASDDVGVTGYAVFQDNRALTTISGTNYQVSGLNPSTVYQFTVSASDAVGNESLQSAPLSVTTLDLARPTIDKILVFTKTAEFRHSSIAKGVATLTTLGQTNNFEVVQTENAADFNTGNLQQYKTVVFLSTTGDVLNNVQQAEFEGYIRAGGSFMGIHAASDTEYDWPWYGQLVGAYFNGHPEIQQASVNVVNSHPSTSQLPNPWNRTDEWYNFRNINPNINVLLNLDESSYDGGTNGNNHPHAWYHTFDGGRSFYTGGGHADANFDEPDFRAHLLGGILYCLGR